MLPTYDDGKAVAIDYETYFSTRDGYSLSMMTPWAYVHDKRFDPYLVAVCGEDIFDPGLAKEPESPDYTLYRNLDDGRQLYVGRPEHFKSWPKLFNRIILAHNAAFDQIVTLRCAELGIIPELTGTQWQCTADMTAYLMVNRSLKDAMKWLFGKEISKAVRAGMDNRHEYELDDRERRDLVAYGGSDAVECHDLWLKYSCRWPEIERKISCQNRDAIRRGFRIDRSYAEKCLKSLKSLQAAVLPDIPWVSRINPKTGTFYAAGSLPALRQEVVNLGVEPPKSFKKDDPGFLDWLKEHDNIPFIKARATYAGTVQHVARIENLIASADGDDLVRPGLVYFGAATGRFAAGLGDDSKAKNINMLNLPRAPLFKGDPRVMDGEGVDLRGMYIPRPHCKLVVFDYSQIEARFALWLVNDTHMMSALEREGNLYQAAAVQMRWCQSGEKIKKTNPKLYLTSKIATLGLGYGLGAAKFVDHCKSQGLELESIPKDKWPELDQRRMFIIRNAGKIHDPFDPKNEYRVGQIIRSMQIVDDWRRANASIVQRWYDYADVFKARAVSNCGTVNFRLPSGRIKTYWNPELVKELTTEIGEDGKEHPSCRVAMRATVVRGKPPKFLTPGNLLENIVQASCRDIMAYSAVEVEDKHPTWQFMFSVYDELIFNIPDEEVQEALVEIPKIMTHGDNIREWTQGLPLEVEGGAFDKYCK